MVQDKKLQGSKKICKKVLNNEIHVDQIDENEIKIIYILMVYLIQI